MPKKTEQTTDVTREFFKRWPRLYTVITYVFGPVLLSGLNPQTFLKRTFPEVGKSTLVNLGSGPKRLRSDIKNYDAESYGEVDVVADITALPIESDSVDGLLCDNVLEHVIDPGKAVAEMHRILKVGGVGYISTPFLYPFHASPHDYQRWTAAGLEVLFRDFAEVEVGVRSGVFSTLNVWLCYVLPTFFSFGSDRLYWLLVNVSLFIFWPVKLLDFVCMHLPFAHRTASVFYCVITK